MDALGECGGDCAADNDMDGICDDVDECVGELDACGVCNGPGAVFTCGCAGIPEGDSPRPGPVPKKAEKAEEAVGERDAGVVYAGGAGGAGAWLGRHKSASAGFFPAAEAALAEHGADGDAGPSARRLSLEHSLGLWRSQSLTNVVGENLKRGLGRIRELVFSGQSEHSDRNYGGDADRDADR